MKRMIALFFVLILLITTKGTNSVENEFLSYADKAVVLSTAIVDEGLSMKIGGEFYTTFDKHQIVKGVSSFDDNIIKGFNLYFSNNLTIDFFKNVMPHMFEGEDVDGKKIYYGYYNGYDQFLWIEGKKVNFQLVKMDKQWILGFPLILTGF